MTRDRVLCARQAGSQRRFFSALGSTSHSAQRLERPGLDATAVPALAWYSVFNPVCIVGDDIPASGLLAEVGAFFDRSGSKAWSVWVPPWLTAPDAAMQAAGLQLDSTPELMGARVDDLDLEPRQPLTLARSATAALVAEINDAAYGVLPEWTMAAAFTRAADTAIRPYVALRDDQPAAALLALEHDRNCYLWFVATVPAHRRRGLASELVRLALRQARENGCDTTTLESTAMAEPAYERLGYRRLGRYRVWEHRDCA